jgi:hypothetical protein
VARQIATSDYAADLEHELVIYCYERPERVEQLHASGALTFYIVRAAINLFRGKTSPFQRKYRHNEERVALGEVEQVDESIAQFLTTCIAKRKQRWTSGRRQENTHTTRTYSCYGWNWATRNSSIETQEFHTGQFATRLTYAGND